MIVKNKLAIVTGGSEGIGRAICETLAREGAKVISLDIKESQFQNVQIESIVIDITNYSGLKEVIKGILNRAKVDILVNNAGIDIVKPFVESEPAEWQKILEVNLIGMFNTCHLIAPHFAENRSGVIINIGSDAGKVGSSGEAVYSATKGGAIAFTKTLARELARDSVRVNCVCPGPTQTALLKSVSDKNPKLVEALTKAIPLRRLGLPEDVAEMVCFLASDKAKFVTGQAISVSGGLTMS